MSGGPSEIAKLADSFNAMASSIEQLFDARRELVAWASHDLRTPLASMQAMIEAIEDGLAAPEDYLAEALREQVRTLSLLVDDLFELARIDAGALTLELHQLPVADLVDATITLLRPEADARHVGLVASASGETTARVAPEKIERVLFNLVTNALRHTPSDGSVAVNVGRWNGDVVVSVEDTGSGLEPEALGRMFERFWLADRARSGAGTGLGLAIARGLVEAHGGRIWAENREKVAPASSFTLPARRLASPALTGSSQKLEKKTGAAVRAVPFRAATGQMVVSSSGSRPHSCCCGEPPRPTRRTVTANLTGQCVEVDKLDSARGA